jgi:hypothetical protein
MQLTSSLSLVAAVVVVVPMVSALVQATLLNVGTTAHALHRRKAVRKLQPCSGPSPMPLCVRRQRSKVCERLHKGYEAARGGGAKKRADTSPGTSRDAAGGADACAAKKAS